MGIDIKKDPWKVQIKKYLEQTTQSKTNFTLSLGDLLPT